MSDDGRIEAEGGAGPVEAHGGRLWATPNEPRGAVFFVMLPIGEALLENLKSSDS
jgi:hypothetical protein